MTSIHDDEPARKPQPFADELNEPRQGNQRGATDDLPDGVVSIGKVVDTVLWLVDIRVKCAQPAKGARRE